MLPRAVPGALPQPARANAVSPRSDPVNQRFSARTWAIVESPRSRIPSRRASDERPTTFRLCEVNTPANEPETSARILLMQCRVGLCGRRPLTTWPEKMTPRYVGSGRTCGRSAKNTAGRRRDRPSRQASTAHAPLMRPFQGRMNGCGRGFRGRRWALPTATFAQPFRLNPVPGISFEWALQAEGLPYSSRWHRHRIAWTPKHPDPERVIYSPRMDATLSGSAGSSGRRRHRHQSKRTYR